MKLGLMTAAFPDLSLDQLAAWASENGFEMLEIACWPPGKAERRYAGVTHIDVLELDETRAKGIRELLEANVMTPDEVLSLDAEVTDQIAAAVQFALDSPYPDVATAYDDVYA